MKYLASAVLAFSALSSAYAEEKPASPPPVIMAQEVQQFPENQSFLPANTEVFLSLNQPLNTKRTKEGETFYLTVTHDVMLDGYVVIPRGSRAVGEVTWVTGKGMFGKSGKMEVDIRYVDAAGARIPVVGTFRQEGSGNTVATVGAVVVVPVAGFFVTGKSGEIPKGRELTVFTRDALPVRLPGPPRKQVHVQTQALTAR